MLDLAFQKLYFEILAAVHLAYQNGCLSFGAASGLSLVGFHIIAPAHVKPSTPLAPGFLQ